MEKIKNKVGRPAIIYGIVVSKTSDYVKHYNKQRYLMNKEMISEHNKMKIHCEHCDKDLSISNYSKHCKSKHHVSNKLKNI
jgi:hypothetical protein